MAKLDEPIPRDKLIHSVGKVNDKSSGLNEVPPDAFKYISKENSLALHVFSTAYWVGVDFSE